MTACIKEDSVKEKNLPETNVGLNPSFYVCKLLKLPELQIPQL